MYKKIFSLFVVCLLCLSFSFADDIAGLESSLDSLSDLEKIDAYHKLSEHYQDIDPKVSTEYGKKGLELSTSLSNNQNIGIFLNDIGMSYYARSDVFQAFDYFDKSIEHNNKNNYKEQLALAYNGKGLAKNLDNAYGEALSLYKLALETIDTGDYPKSKAIILNNLGSIHETLSELDTALNYYLDALKINESLELKEEIASSLNNVGFVHDELGNAEKAQEYYFSALAIYQELNNKQGSAVCLNNIAQIFLNNENYEEALKYFANALMLNEETGNKTEVLTVLNNLGVTYNSLGLHEEAIKYFNKALSESTKLNNYQSMANAHNNIGTTYYYLNDLENAFIHHNQALELYNEIEDKEGLMYTFKNLSDDHYLAGNYEDSYKMLAYYDVLKDIVFEDNQLEAIQNMQVKYETEKKEQENELLTKDKEILEKNKRIQQIIIGLSILIILIVSVLGFNIAKERKKSERLLLNVLPKKVASDLKSTGKSEPEIFEDVTIYFSDIAGFTSTSSTLDPKYLIYELSDIFTHFDDIMANYGCERIKTIGDAYFGVCGLPSKDPNHAENIMKASIDILRYLNERNKTADTTWRIRIGLHSGKVVGGIVGVKKYIYDLFGDTVNTASRMESNGAPMRINISQETYELLEGIYTFETREPMEVKGKGIYNMYFLTNDLIYGDDKII